MDLGFCWFRRVVVLVFFFFSVNDCAASRQEQFTMYSGILEEERRINVWLPDDFEEKSANMPVLYMADGGLEEDFPQLAATVSKLIEEGKIRPIALVGIENTQRRRDLTGDTDVEADRQIAPVVGGAPEFRSFIRDELFGEIELRYKINGKKGMIGESLAGLFVVETLLLRPETFDLYIAFDPSLWWDNQFLINFSHGLLENNPPPSEVKLWLSSSGSEGFGAMLGSLYASLERYASPLITYKYVHHAEERHHTIFSAAREEALVWVFGED